MKDRKSYIKRAYNLVYNARRCGASIDTKDKIIYAAWDNTDRPSSRYEDKLVSEYGYVIQLTITQ